MLNLCTPALVYFAISIVAILVMLFTRVSATTIMSNILTCLLWTWFLNFICDRVSDSVSWGLVVFPYLVMAISGIIIYKYYGEEIKKDLLTKADKEKEKGKEKGKESMIQL